MYLPYVETLLAFLWHTLICHRFNLNLDHCFAHSTNGLYCLLTGMTEDFVTCIDLNLCWPQFHALWITIWHLPIIIRTIAKLLYEQYNYLITDTNYIYEEVVDLFSAGIAAYCWHDGLAIVCVKLSLGCFVVLIAVVIFIWLIGMYNEQSLSLSLTFLGTVYFGADLRWLFRFSNCGKNSQYSHQPHPSSVYTHGIWKSSEG